MWFWLLPKHVSCLSYIFPMSLTPICPYAQTLVGLGFNIPMVWQSMNLQITPETVTPGDVFAAAQVSGAPPPLVHQLLQEAAFEATQRAQLQQQQQQLLLHQHQAMASSMSSAISPLGAQLQSLSIHGGPGGGGPVVHHGIHPGYPHHQHLSSGAMTTAAASSSPRNAPVPPLSPSPSMYRLDSPWQQDLDPVSGHHYYFNTSIGVTQWEVPPCGFRPKGAMTIGALEERLLLQGAEGESGAGGTGGAHDGPLQQLQQPDLVGEQASGSKQGSKQLQQRKQGGPLSSAGLISALGHSPGTPPKGPSHDAKAKATPKSRKDIEQEQQQRHSLSGQPRSRRGSGGGLGGLPRSRRNSSSGGNHPSNKTWQQLEMLQQLDAEEEEERQRRVELDPDTAAYVRTMLPRNMAKYWLQRYSLFSKYDQGIQMDTEGW